MNEASIRRATIADALALSLIGSATFLETFAGIVNGADVIAHCASEVLSRFHGTGVGARLMEAALAEAKRRGARRALLGVYAQNHRALAFYAKQGFTRVGERRFQVGANTYGDYILARQLRS